MSSIDMVVLKQLAEDISPEDLRLVVATFEEDIQRLSAAMGSAAERVDLPVYRRAAHSLAGVAGAIGAVALERQARDAMIMPDGKAASAAAVMPSVLDLVDEAVSVLRRFAADGISSS